MSIFVIFGLESGIFQMMKFDEKLLRTGLCQIAVLLLAGVAVEALFVGGEIWAVITGATIGAILMFLAIFDFRR